MLLSCHKASGVTKALEMIGELLVFLANYNSKYSAPETKYLLTTTPLGVVSIGSDLSGNCGK